METDSIKYLYDKLSMFVTCNTKFEVLRNEVDELLNMFKDTKIDTKEVKEDNPVINIFEFVSKKLCHGNKIRSSIGLKLMKICKTEKKFQTMNHIMITIILMIEPVNLKRNWFCTLMNNMMMKITFQMS